MNKETVVCLHALSSKEVDQVIDIVVDCFQNVMKQITKDRNILKGLLSAWIQYDLTYALIRDGKVCGFVAVSDAKRRALRITKESCVKYFGKIKGPILAWQVTQLVGKPEVHEQTFGYVDFLGTAVTCRHTGVAEALLRYIEEHMRYEEYYLDVMESNVVARNLYEKLGYQVTSCKHSMMMRLAKMDKIFFMKKRCNKPL